MIKFITADNIRDNISMVEAINALRDVNSMLDHGVINLNDRIRLNLNNNESKAFVMPSYIPMLNALSVKIATSFPENVKKGLPLIDAVVVFVNTSTGQIEMIIDGQYLTAMRTGAMCGLVTSLVAPVSANTMAIIGAGVQARFVSEAVISVRTIKHIKIYSRTKESSKGLQKHIQSIHKSIDVEICANPNDAVRDVDIICTCTSNGSIFPVFTESKLKEGVHINAIGGRGVDSVELPIRLYEDALQIVEDIRTAKLESGEVKAAYKENYINETSLVTVGAIINNKINLSNISNCSIYRSVGMSIQDTAISAKIYELLNQT